MERAMSTTPAALRIHPELRLTTEGAVVESADAPGLEAAVGAHGGELFGFALRSLRDRGLAEDAVQETFVRAWRARARFDPAKGSMRSWLFAIERHVVIDLVRVRARHDQRRSFVPLVDVPSRGEEMERSTESWHIHEAIKRLRPAHRQVLVEIYYRQRTSAEVAHELAIPEGTVRSRLFYALQSLKSVLEESDLNT
jgi:RNA polymerase sigma-70 factor, ECF subfamily